jgi:hypothetical protein
MAKGILGLAPTNGIDKTPAFALVDLMGREKQPLTAQLINLIIANMARYFEGYTPNGEGPDEEKLREIYGKIMEEFASLYPKQMVEEAHELGDQPGLLGEKQAEEEEPQSVPVVNVAVEGAKPTKRKKKGKTQPVAVEKPAQTPEENILTALYKETSVHQNADGSISIHTVSPSDKIKKVEVSYRDSAGIEQPTNWTITQHVIPATIVSQMGERVTIVIKATDNLGKQHTKLEHFNIVSTYPTYLPLGEDETYAFNPSQTLKATDVVYDVSLPADSAYGANLNFSLENNRVVFITTGKVEKTVVPITVRTSTGTKVFNVTVAQDEKPVMLPAETVVATAIDRRQQGNFHIGTNEFSLPESSTGKGWVWKVTMTGALLGPTFGNRFKFTVHKPGDYTIKYEKVNPITKETLGDPSEATITVAAKTR